jgi:branched-chain amino acid transport system permease protein
MFRVTIQCSGLSPEKEEDSVEIAVSAIVNMLVLSSMYIVVALGFAFLFSILGILNLAHGALYMVGGYLCFQLVEGWHLNGWLSLIIATAIVGAFGLFLEKFCFRPFSWDLNRIIIICIAISVALTNTVNIMVGVTVRSIPAFVSGVIKAGAFSLSSERLVTFIIGGCLLAFMVWFINKTRTGQQMQAISQNLTASKLTGINVFRVSALACAMACALAALAGCLMGAYLNLNTFMGDTILWKAIVILTLGGIGSIGGIFFAGIIIGSLDAILPVFVTGATSDAIALGIIIVILIFRPQGFFGHEVT